MLFGAHVSAAGGISTAVDRAAELRCDAVQVFTQSPRMWKPTAHADEELARFRERRRETRIRYVVCHALYLVNLATTDREMHAKSMTAMRASLETAAAIEADGVVFHLGSHLGAGLAKGSCEPSRRSAELLELTDDRLWLLLENSAGAGGTIGRSTDELADARRPARRPPPARHLPRLVPLVGLGRGRHRPRRRSTSRSRDSTRRSASTASAAST